MFESLESRTLFAAPVGDVSPAALPTESISLNFTKVEYGLNFTKIKFDTKVSQQDFHFVMKINKPSPKL